MLKEARRNCSCGTETKNDPGLFGFSFAALVILPQAVAANVRRAAQHQQKRGKEHNHSVPGGLFFLWIYFNKT